MRYSREKLRRARERLGYSIETVGERAGTSKNSVLRAEHEGEIRPLTARKIAEALGVEVADLLHEELSASGKVREPLSLKEASSAPARFSELPGLMAARERRGISRNELAVRSGMSPPDVAGLEEGTREADPDILERLTAALGATPGELSFPPEQYAAYLEAGERENERIRRELAELDPSEMRALIMRSLLESRGARKVSDAINESLEQRIRKRPEAG